MKRKFVGPAVALATAAVASMAAGSSAGAHVTGHAVRHSTSGHMSMAAAHMRNALAGYCGVAAGPANVGVIAGATNPTGQSAVDGTFNQTANMASLDIMGVYFKQSAANLDVIVQVQNLADPTGTAPQIWGDGDIWDITFTGANGKTYWIGAEYGMSSPVDRVPGKLDYYVYGHDTPPDAAGQVTVVTDGYETGSYSLADNTLQFEVPLSVIGGSNGSTHTIALSDVTSDVYVGAPRADLTETYVYGAGNSLISQAEGTAESEWQTLPSTPAGDPISGLPTRMPHGELFRVDSSVYGGDIAPTMDFQLGKGCVPIGSTNG